MIEKIIVGLGPLSLTTEMVVKATINKFIDEFNNSSHVMFSQRLNPIY